MGKRKYEYLAPTLIETIKESLEAKLVDFQRAADNEIEVFGQGRGCVRGLQVALNMVEDAAKNNGWLSVAERLPDVPKGLWSTSKLTRWSSGAIRISSFYNADSGATWWLDEVTCEPEGHKVTHWQELPEFVSPAASK